ncbi:MAG TPA: hypothetical protein VJK72_00240 [Candidatus Nanoarchaeia archaeon]|nr:hypothetical protein [Candidatus Nanoarchaeia archaeon]
MDYRASIKTIGRAELDEVVRMLELINAPSKVELSIFGYKDANDDLWTGHYRFTYERKQERVNGDFTRTSKSDYKGTVSLTVVSEPSDLMKKILRVAPTIAHAFSKSAE